MPAELIDDFMKLLEKVIILIFHYIQSSLKSRSNKKFAYVLSFLFAGTGVAYLGNEPKGLTIFIVSIILIPLRIFSSFGLMFSVFSFLLWAYGMFATYQEANLINQY